MVRELQIALLWNRLFQPSLSQFFWDRPSKILQNPFRLRLKGLLPAFLERFFFKGFLNGFYQRVRWTFLSGMNVAQMSGLLVRINVQFDICRLDNFVRSDRA